MSSRTGMSRWLVLTAGLVWTISCASDGAGNRAEAHRAKPNEEPNTAMVYTIQKAATPPALDGAWDSAAWQQAATIDVNHFHAKSSRHRPVTQARLLYDDKGVYVSFRVKDQYVRATCTEYGGPVCRDSCAEFFVKPKPDKGYFNFEMNCGGKLLLYYIEDPTRNPGGSVEEFKKYTRVPKDVATRMRIYHSMPEYVFPEREEKTEWRVAYFIPFSIFEEFVGPLGPVAGQTWRGNLYKCADASSHPHWATWAPIGKELNFHQPKYFGTLRFAE